MHNDYQGWSLRNLEAEIDVGKSTLGRVRTQLIRDGELAHPVFGAKMPEWMPESHASTFIFNSAFADDDQMEQVYAYVQLLAPHGDPRNWEWDQESEQVVHSGLIDDKVVAFGIEENLVVKGFAEQAVRGR